MIGRLPRTLRARVALAAAASILVALAVLGGAVLLLTERELSESRERALRDGAAAVARLNATAPALIESASALDVQPGGRTLYVQVVDPQGSIVGRSASLGGRFMPLEGPIGEAVRGDAVTGLDARLGGEEVRVLVAPLAVAGAGPAAGGAVIVATETAEDERTLRQLRLVLAGSAAAAALLAALAATVLTRRALAPLARLSSAARAIEATGDPSRRLPDPATGDELGALAGTLNGMLAALERASERERRFVADASHELRTPLTALRGNAAYVARHGADRDALADLERDAARLARLLDDLLALAREDAAPAPSDEVELVQVAREVAAPRARVDVDGPEPVRVRGDRAALQRAIANLVENGERHGPAEGRVRVEVRMQDSVARVRICDEGPGLVAERAERAFERFWRGGAGDEVGGGSGLGLAIVRATAERHGGRAAVDADGSVVLELPALRDVSGTGATTAAHPSEEPS